jgi:hypothetical protein
MTGDTGDGGDERPKRATLRTRHDDPAVVARAVRPDNTDAMRTTAGDGADGRTPSDEADDSRVVTRIERPTTGGLRSTVDDYVVNLRVAETVAAIARGADATDVHARDEADVDARDTDGTPAERTGASHEQNDSDITTHDTHDT